MTCAFELKYEYNARNGVEVAFTDSQMEVECVLALQMEKRQSRTLSIGGVDMDLGQCLPDVHGRNSRHVKRKSTQVSRSVIRLPPILTVSISKPLLQVNRRSSLKVRDAPRGIDRL